MLALKVLLEGLRVWHLRLVYKVGERQEPEFMQGRDARDDYRKMPSHSCLWPAYETVNSISQQRNS